MDDKYWDNMSAKYNDEIFDVLKSDTNGVVSSCIKEVSSPRKTVGDVGCAIGKWVPLLSSEFKKVYAIDFSGDCLRFAEKRYNKLPNVSYLKKDFSKAMSYELMFDVILCVNSIITDSFARRETFFKNLYNSLNKNGHMILVVPSMETILYKEFIFDRCERSNMVFEKQKLRKAYKKMLDNFKLGVVDIDRVPTKHYLKEELTVILEAIGFKIQKIEKVEYSWKTEIDPPPRWLKEPNPWDWMVHVKK